MELIEIKSADGASSINFLDREPLDASVPIDYFAVRLADSDLHATARVYAYHCAGLPDLCTCVAQNWQDFAGPQTWSSIEGEFTLAITHDGMGHFTIIAELRSGPYERDWCVKSSVMVETSQLDRIAAEVSGFIGRHA